MKKTLFVVILVCLIAVSASSQNAGPIRLYTSAGASVSISSVYLTLNPQIRYAMSRFAVGGGVKNYLGLAFTDVYTAPYVVGSLGSLYLGLGATFRIVDPDPAKSETGYALPEAETEGNLVPFITMGISKGIKGIGPGSLGFDISLDFLPSAVPVEEVDDSESDIGDIIGSIIATAAEAIFNSAKIGIAALYTISF